MPDALTCAEVFQRIQDYLDRELTPEEMERVREHLELCAWCAREVRFEGTVLREIRGRLARIDAPPDLLRKVRLAIDSALDEP